MTYEQYSDQYGNPNPPMYTLMKYELYVLNIISSPYFSIVEEDRNILDNILERIKNYYA